MPAARLCRQRDYAVRQCLTYNLLPALDITAEQVDEGCRVICDVLREMAKTAA